MATLPAKIPKHNASPFGNQACDIQYHLLDKNAGKIVNGTEKPPAKAHDQPPLNDFESRSLSTLATFTWTLSLNLAELQNIDNPEEAWKKLQVHFHPDNSSFQKY